MVAAWAKGLSRYVNALLDIHDSEDALNYDMTADRRAAGWQA
jgi:hypothetical protein